MSKAQIKAIELEIDGKTIRLTLEEAESLLKTLSALIPQIPPYTLTTWPPTQTYVKTSDWSGTKTPNGLPQIWM